MNENEVNDPVLSRVQAARLLNIGPCSLDLIVRRKGLRFFRVGRRVLFKKSWVDAWIESQAEDEKKGGKQ